MAARRRTCADPRGHIQAMGTDEAGRRQYRYHDLWRQQRDRAKHDRVLEAAVRLVNLGFFRPGGEEYAEENGTFGLAAIRKEPPA